MSGGFSDSDQDTKNTDARVVGSEGSVNVSAQNGGDVNVTTTDAGAVSASMALAMKGVEGAQTIAAQTIDQNAELLKGVVTATREGQEQFASALENVKTADTRMLAIGALAVVGLAAARVWGK